MVVGGFIFGGFYGGFSFIVVILLFVGVGVVGLVVDLIWLNKYMF